jgi:phage terminase small subunit
MSNREMTVKQQLFAQEYICDFNGTRSAIAAGFSQKSASRIAVELLQKPQVMEAIAAGKADRSERVKITADEVIMNIIRIGGKAEAAGKFGDALAAQALLGRHLAMFTDKVQVPGEPDSIQIIFRRDAK